MVGILIFDFDAKTSTKMGEGPPRTWWQDLLRNSRKKLNLTGVLTGRVLV